MMESPGERGMTQLYPYTHQTATRPAPIGVPSCPVTSYPDRNDAPQRKDQPVSAKTRKQQLEELLELDPDDSFVRYGLAMEHAGAGQDGEAVKLLDDLLRRDPGYVPAYLQAGRALIRLGEDERARDVLRRGIAIAQKAGDGHAAGEVTGFLESLG